MLYPKEYVSGKPINLSQYELGIINQPKVDIFMQSDNDIVEFLKPFYIEQTIMLNEEFKQTNMPLSMLIASSQDNHMISYLIKSLMLLYETGDIKLSYIDDKYVIIIKKDGKGYANISDENLHVLSDVVFEIMYHEKPEPEPKYEGDADLIKIVKQKEAEYKKRKMKDNILTFEIMVHNVIHYKNLYYDKVKDWTVWQMKDAYMVEICRENKEDSYLLAAGGHYKVNLKQVKDWKKENRVVHDSVLNS